MKLCTLAVSTCLLASVAPTTCIEGQSAAAAPMNGSHRPGPPATSLSVSVPQGQVNFSPGDLQRLPQVSVDVRNAHTGRSEHYTGVKLTDLLVKAGAELDKRTLHSYVVATGTDGYWVVLSGEEITDTLHAGTVLIATSLDGRPLGTEGAFKLIASEDKKPERWVRELATVRLVVVNAGQ